MMVHIVDGIVDKYWRDRDRGAATRFRLFKRPSVFLVGGAVRQEGLRRRRSAVMDTTYGLSRPDSANLRHCVIDHTSMQSLSIL